ncbi:MAG TPA: GNAT family N-acetyltransferase [Hyphomicrobiaceae bacterium]|jgi:aminoglycoside 6'-N-acetyltransferase
MTNEVAVRLRPAVPEDRFRIRRWLADPQIAAAWGNAASAEAEISLALASPTALCRIIDGAGTPIGYAHALEIGLWTEERPSELPAGTWHIGYFLAGGDNCHGRTGAAVLALLSTEVFATTLAVACSSLVSVKAETAARAYERAGFRWRRIWNDRLLGPSWLMLRERPV